MNNNFNQPYVPSGEIKFDQFNPNRIGKNNNFRRNKKVPHASDQNSRLHAEYKRLSRRMKEIESILNIKNPNFKDGKPIRYGNEFRNYSYKQNKSSFKKAPIVNKEIVKDVEKDIVDTKKELGF